MQKLTARLLKVVRAQRFWGLAAITLVAVLAVVAARVYISPPGDKTVTFYTGDAASISTGMSVRIAGVPVGKITTMALEPDQVRVQAAVRRDVFVGDQSTVEVRMLTVAGGYYTDIESVGDRPLGSAPIPKDRVVMPYDLIRALADSSRITDDLAAAPIKRSLDEVQRGLSGPNIDTVSAIVQAGTALTDTLDAQRGQLGQILNLSDEYIRALSGFRGRLQELIEKFSILEQTLVLYGKGFAVALAGISDIMAGIGPIGVFYKNHRERFVEKFTHWQQTVRTWADRNGLIVRILHRTRDRLYAALDRQNAPPELLATDLCIPVPGSPC